jgi:hemerythrin
MYIRWDQSYETGHPLIDAEHRLLVMLFRKLDIAIKTRQPEATMVRIVLEVKRFVEFHFVSEENLMLESGFPGAEAHRMRHQELLLALVGRIDKLHAHADFPDDLLDFLYRWLSEHIAQEDRLVARHLLTAVQRPVGEMVYDEYLGAAVPAAGPVRTGAPGPVAPTSKPRPAP